MLYCIISFKKRNHINTIVLLPNWMSLLKGSMLAKFPKLNLSKLGLREAGSIIKDIVKVSYCKGNINIVL